MKPVKEYPGRQALLLEAAKAKIDARRVRVLLWLIQAPPTLTDLHIVLCNLRRVLVIAERNWPLVLRRVQLAFLLPLLDSLLEVLSKFQIPEPPQNAANHRDWLGKDGNLDRNPFYFALRALPPNNSPHAYRCCLLLAHVFLAHVAILREPNRLEENELRRRRKGNQTQPRRNSSLPAYDDYDFESPWAEVRVPCRHAGLSIRDFCIGKAWARRLIRNLPLSLSPVEFAKALPAPVDCDDDERRRYLEHRLSYICNYVRQARGLKARHLGHGRKPQNDTGSDGYGQPNEEDSRTGANVPGNITSDHNNVGQAREEQGDHQQTRGGKNDAEQALANGSGPRTQNRTEERNERQGDAIGSLSNQAIRSSKAFTFDFDRLAACELVPIDTVARNDAHDMLDALLAEKPFGQVDLIAGASARLDMAELYTFALVQLWTNSTAKRTKLLSISTDMDFNEDIPLVILMSRGGGGRDACVRVRARWPKECDSSQGKIKFDRERSKYPLLPDVADLGPLLWKLATLKGKFDSDERSFQVFDKPVAHYKTGINRLLEKWDKTGRLTPSRLCHALYWALMAWSGKDIVATTMVTGDYKKQARVPMFYGCRRMDVLRLIYSWTVQDLRYRVEQEAVFALDPNAKRAPIDYLLSYQHRSASPPVFRPSPAGALYVGTKPCPTDIDMQRAVRELIDQLNAPCDLRDLKQRVRHTNLYTLYCVWGHFGFWTGCRPICDPYLRLSALNPLDRSALLDDKREEKARLIWIGGDLYLQMERYEKFLKATGLWYADKHPCWLLAEDGRPLQVRPRTLTPVLHEFLPGFQLNTNRRYVMNALWDAGCPPEIVRLWSGQATVGNAFWASGATGPLAEMRVTLHAYLKSIMNYVGFRPLPGATS